MSRTTAGGATWTEVGMTEPTIETGEGAAWPWKPVRYHGGPMNGTSERVLTAPPSRVRHVNNGQLAGHYELWLRETGLVYEYVAVAQARAA